MDKNQNGKSKTLLMVQLSLFSALIVILAFTPNIGYIPLGFTRATIIHIPVIIGSILLGPVSGGFLGGVFGLTSLIMSTVNPTVVSFAFSPFYSIGDIHGGWQSLIICFIPRILTGIVPYYVYKLVSRIMKNKNGEKTLSLAAAGISGSLINTLLVMNLIFLFYKDAYAFVNEKKVTEVYDFIVGIICINGIPEAIAASVIVTLICRVLFKTKITAGQGVLKNPLQNSIKNKEAAI